MENQSSVDFFISYTKSDKAWAEWIAWKLEEEKYSVLVQEWDFVPGKNFVVEMDSATKRSKRTIAILSSDYLNSSFCTSEWTAAFAKDPIGSQRKILPIRVKECELTGLLAQIVYVDLVGLDPDWAKERLLASAKMERAKPSKPPPFPGENEGVPEFPGKVNQNIIEEEKLHRSKEKIALFKLEGNIDWNKSRDIDTAIHQSIESGCKFIVIDLSKVNLLCSGGIGAIVYNLKKVNEMGGGIYLVASSDYINFLFAVIRLNVIFENRMFKTYSELAQSNSVFKSIEEADGKIDLRVITFKK